MKNLREIQEWAHSANPFLRPVGTAVRVTISLNTNQTRRTPLLVPILASTGPTAPVVIRSLVFKTAQTKLRLNKPTRIFIARTGEELLTEVDWSRNFRNDVILLVSAGEDYVGVNENEGRHGELVCACLQGFLLTWFLAEANPECPVHVLAHEAQLDRLSVAQLDKTSRTLPGVIHAVGQPDLHPGTKYPIGAVFVSKWIHPPLIGGDIGCGMAWYQTTLSSAQVDGDKAKKVAEKLRGLEGAWRTQSERE